MRKKNIADLKTVRDYVRFVYSRFNKAELFYGHGNTNAWDEAVNLVLHAINLPLDELEPFLDCRLVKKEKKRVMRLAQARVEKRIPLPYLTGEAWLQGVRFKTSPDVIIPRSPVAELLADRLMPWVEDPDAELKILDLCCGSGCLGILAAMAFPNASVDLSDIDEQALKLARENVQMHKLEARVNVIKSDLFSDFDPPRKYDLIICNPPYVNQESMDALPPEYCYEPQLALAAGVDGMSVVRKILTHAADSMTDDGLLVLEIGHEFHHFTAAFPDLEVIWLETAEAGQQIMLLRRDQLVGQDFSVTPVRTPEE